MTIDVNVTVLVAVVAAVTVAGAVASARPARPGPVAAAAAAVIVLFSAAAQLVIALIVGDLTVGTALLVAAVRGAAVGWVMTVAVTDLHRSVSRTLRHAQEPSVSNPVDDGPGPEPTDPF